jgi:hypothetical protein
MNDMKLFGGWIFFIKPIDNLCPDKKYTDTRTCASEKIELLCMSDGNNENKSLPYL